ncbi:MAG: hypothetical protein JWN40_168 [Phycisphaerales bacterium]|nr:hypothetical protein [Phycisphaerales bacterium]
MATADSRPPRVLLESITSQAERVRQAAAELTKRIEHFQEWLGKVPGRVETDYYGDHPNAKDEEDRALMSFVIRLNRSGKEWILSYATHDERWSHESSGPFTEFKPLVDAPLKTKIAAVKMFPNILAAIEKSQIELVSELDAATSEYDAFAATLMATHPEADHLAARRRRRVDMDPSLDELKKEDMPGHAGYMGIRLLHEPKNKGKPGPAVDRANASSDGAKKEGK